MKIRKTEDFWYDDSHDLYASGNGSDNQPFRPKMPSDYYVLQVYDDRFSMNHGWVSFEEDFDTYEELRDYIRTIERVNPEKICIGYHVVDNKWEEIEV